MTLAKLLPATTALHEAAAKAAAAQTAAPQVHKYVVLQSSNALRLPERVIVFQRELTHAEVVPQGVKAVSAGFVAVVGGCVKVASGVPSETLKIGPRPEDQQLLEQFFSAL